MRQVPALAVVLTAAALLFGGCGGEPASAPGAAGSAAEETAPERIVPLAPNLTEIAFELGLGDRVVGVSEYASWPLAAEALPRLGGLFDPNLERMVALEPDLVLLLPSQEEVARHLAAVGVPSLTVEIETVEDLSAAVRAIAGRCGVPAAGEALAERLARELGPRPIPGAPPAVIVLDRDVSAGQGVLVAGPGTFYQDLLERLGSDNVFADSPIGYSMVGAEEVLGRAPRAILEIRPREMPAGARERLLAEWRRYPSLPAAETGDVYLIDAPWTVVLGPRLPQLYEAMERALRRAAGAS